MLTAARIAAALEAGRKTGLGYIPWVYPAPAYAPWTTPAAPYTPQVAQPTCPPGYSMSGGECVLNQSAWQKFAQTVNQLNTSGNVVPAIPPSAAAALQAAISNVLNMLRTSGAPNCMSGSNPVVLAFQQAYNAFSPSKIQASGCYDTATQAALGQVGVNNPPPPMSGVPQPTNQAPLVLMPENFESDTAGRGAEQKPVPVPPTYSSSEGTVPVAHQFRPSDQGYPPSPAAPSTTLSESLPASSFETPSSSHQTSREAPVAPHEYRGPLAGLPHTKGSPMLTTAGISTALEAGRKAGLGAAARPAAPAITDVHWKALPGPLFAKLWAQPTFRNAYNAGTVTNNVFGAGSQWMTFRYGNVWYSRVLAAGPGQGYRYFIYVPAQLRGLGAAAPNPQLAPAGVGQALLSAASSLDDLLSASGAPPYTSGTGTNSGPSNPTVLAFQQAWNQDSAVSATQLLEDGRYGSQTYAAINSLGYSEPAPIVTYGGSGTIIQPGGSQTAGISTSDANNQSVTIFGVPTWIIIAAAAVGGVAIVGTAVASQHGQAIKSQMTKTTQTVRRHAARLHPRHLMHA